MEDHWRTVLFLEAKGIDWDAVHEKYRKLVVPTMSNDDLFDLLSQMLYTLKDGHVNLSSAKRTFLWWVVSGVWLNYREDILYQTYLGSASSGYYTAAGLKYKIFDNNIGYIRYESFSAGVGNGNLMEYSSLPVTLQRINHWCTRQRRGKLDKLHPYRRPVHQPKDADRIHSAQDRADIMISPKWNRFIWNRPTVHPVAEKGSDINLTVVITAQQTILSMRCAA